MTYASLLSGCHRGFAAGRHDLRFHSHRGFAAGRHA